jgi:hypothetical protein
MPVFTIRDHIASLNAGGPGSGRHPEGGQYSTRDVLRTNGWKSRVAGNTYTHQDHDGHEVKVSNGGHSWAHTKWSGDSFKVVARGQDQESLDRHLKVFHGK